MKNLDTLTPIVSISVAELANIETVEQQQKSPKQKELRNFALMATAGRKNALAETVNFVLNEENIIKNPQNQKTTSAPLFL